MKASLSDIGTLDLFIEDANVVSLATLDNAAAIGSGSLGTQDTLATTTGTILFDDFVFDDGQIFRDKRRFPGTNLHMNHVNDHPIVGATKFSAAVTSTGGDAILTLYDTDGIPTNLTPFVTISSSASPEFVPGHDIFEVQYGVYAVMSGTAAQAFFSVVRGGTVSQGGYVTKGQAQHTPRP